MLRLLMVGATVVLVLAAVALIHSRVSQFIKADSDLRIMKAVGATSRVVWLTVATDELLMGLVAQPIALGLATVVLVVLQPLVGTGDHIDLRSVLVVTLATGFLMSTVTTLIAGAMVARRFQDQSLGIAGARIVGTHVGRGWRRRASLAVAFATALALVIAGCVAVGLLRLNKLTLGFSPANLVAIDLRLNFTQYKTAADVARFEQEAEDALKRVPDLAHVSVSSGIPVFAPGRTVVMGGGPVEGRLETTEYRVDPGYFHLLHIPIKRGRAFADKEPSAVAIVSEACARRLGSDAIGATLPLSVPTRIVGIAGDVASRIENWDHCAVYVPLNQETTWTVRLLAEFTGGVPGLEGRLRKALAQVDPSQPVERVAFLDQVVSDALAPRYGTGAAVGALTMIAWLLAAAWCHSLIASSLSERRREIGVRLASGGSRFRVAWAITRSEMTPLAIGGVCGLVAGIPAVSLTRSLDASIGTAATLFVCVVACTAAACASAVGVLAVWRTTAESPRALLG